MSITTNPINNILNIESAHKVESVLIFDAFGHLIQQETKSRFSINKLKSGIYTVGTKTAEGVNFIKFVKE